MLNWLSIIITVIVLLIFDQLDNLTNHKPWASIAAASLTLVVLISLVSFNLV